MARPRSKHSSDQFRRLARFAVYVGSLVAICAGVRGERAYACGGGDWGGIAELTTFDPKLLGEWDGLAYDPDDAGFGGGCTDCLTTAMVADWTSYLKGVVPADWQKILIEATDQELAALRTYAGARSRTAKPPKGYETSSVWKATASDAATRARVVAAIEFVKLARTVEPYASFDTYGPDGIQRTVKPPPANLATLARAGMKGAAKDPFLAQRYAFQVLRVTFYARDWKAAIAFHDRNTAALAGPSRDLAWRARHYLAGSLMRSGKRGRANLELARIASNYQPLAGLAALEFAPAEDTDWKEALRLAKTARERTELWRMVGIRKDGLVAIQEILKIDPKSNLLGLLLVRELAKAESRVSERYPWQGKPDPKNILAQKKMYAQLEQIAVGQLARGGDRPWLMELVAGHVAAKRGDLATARTRLARAISGNPSDPRVAAQARASLAVALAATWKLGDSSAEGELATAMAGLDEKFGRLATVKLEVRGKLAAIYAAAGKLVDAEYLHPGTVERIYEEAGKVNKGKPNWEQPAFIRQMLARGLQKSTPFERFVVAGSFTQDQLKLELGMRLILDGDFTGALANFTSTNSKKLGADPFVIHVKDCHDCDHEKYKNSAWDHLALAKKLIELEAKAKRGGEAGAEAALAIGNALYNLTHYGNARTATMDTHQKTHDTSTALAWYKRAHDLSRNRELKVKAAFMAAKAELGQLMNAQQAAESYSGGLPIPKTWFPVVKQYKTTRYYREILKECGHYASWAK